MATNGIKRLNDMHSGKNRKKPLTTEEDIRAVDAIPQKATIDTSAKVINFNKKQVSMTDKELKTFTSSLSKEENAYFASIFEKIKQEHPDNPAKYTLAAINLAKLYAQQAALEKELENYGGYLLQNEKGTVYVNPAAVLLQRVQTGIIRNLTILGLSHNAKTAAKKNEDFSESEFAQFK